LKIENQAELELEDAIMGLRRARLPTRPPPK
jgi:hypothetical protein